MMFVRTLKYLLILTLVPSVALADELQQIRSDADTREIRIVLDADAPIAEPRVRMENGRVRLWFPDLGTSSGRLTAQSTPGIRRIVAREGYSGTALLQLDLNDKDRSLAGALSVSLDGNRAIVRIARSALEGSSAANIARAAASSSEPLVVSKPSSAPNSERRSSRAVAPRPERIEQGASRNEVRAENDEAPHTKAASAEAAPVAKVAAETLPLAPKASFRDGAAPNEPPASKHMAANTLGIGVDQIGSGMNLTLLIVLTVLLAVAYLGLRLFLGAQKQSGGQAAIEVIASKRIGARHQLILVRAGGQDHLISIHGGRTQQIASMPITELAPEETPAPRSPLTLIAGLKERLQRETDKSKSRRNSRDNRATFDMMVKKAAKDRRDAVATKRQATAAADEDASPVTGLLQLRKQALS